MPSRFLSDAEIERLDGFPEAIDAVDLARHFRLDSDDLSFVRRQHGAAGQLGIALQLCSLRWLGFIPEELPAAPADAVAILANALDTSPRAIFDYTVRPQTRREHRPLVREHAGFRAAGERELQAVRDWLVERALEHERPSLLFGELCGELRRRRVERPAVPRLMRIVAWARERAHEHTFERLAPQLTSSLRGMLDDLLVPDQTTAGRTRHAWLRARPTSISARSLRGELDKRTFLIDAVGANRLELDGLPPNRRAWLAQAGRQSTNQALARLTPERRYPVLVCFCAEALERVTDDALEVFDRALGAADRAAQRRHDELRRHHDRDIRTTVRRFIDLAQAVLEAHDGRTDVLRLVERRIGLDRLRQDLDRAHQINRPQGDSHLDLLIDGAGAAGRKLLGAVIANIELNERALTMMSCSRRCG